MASHEVVGKVLLTQEQIWQRAQELGAEISRDYAGEEVVLIGTLKGAVMFMADIMKSITLDTPVSYTHLTLPTKA